MTRNSQIIGISLIAAFSLGFWGCAKKPLIKESVGQVPETTPAETPKQEEAQDIEASIRGKDFTDVPQVATIYFDLDSSQIRPDMREVLAKNAEFLKTNSKLEIRVDGHCDERGTTEYNLALGQKRSSSIRAYYKSLGIKGSRIGTMSWGEEKSVCQEAVESCWQKNRRAETKVRLKEDKKTTSSVPMQKSGLSTTSQIQ